MSDVDAILAMYRSRGAGSGAAGGANENAVAGVAATSTPAAKSAGAAAATPKRRALGTISNGQTPIRGSRRGKAGGESAKPAPEAPKEADNGAQVRELLADKLSLTRELREALARVQGLEDERGILITEVAAVEAELDATRTAKDATEEEHQALIERLITENAQLKGTVAELSAAAEVTAERCAEVAALEAALAERGAALDVQAESLALVTQENTLLREHEAAMEGALEALQDRVAVLEAELAAAKERATADNDVTALTERMEAAAAEAAATEARADSLETQLGAVLTTNATLAGRLASTEARLEAMESELAAAVAVASAEAAKVAAVAEASVGVEAACPSEDGFAADVDRFDEAGAGEGETDVVVTVPVASPSSRAVSGIDFEAAIEAADADSSHVAHELKPCPVCARKFAPGRIAKHVKACRSAAKADRKLRKRVSEKKDAAAKRHPRKRGGPPGARRRRSGSLADAHTAASSSREAKTKQVKFLRRKSVTYGNLGEKHGKLKVSAKSRLSEGVKYTACPHCARSFNARTATRHIEVCKENQHKPAPPPTANRFADAEAVRKVPLNQRGTFRPAPPATAATAAVIHEPVSDDGALGDASTEDPARQGDVTADSPVTGNADESGGSVDSEDFVDGSHDESGTTGSIAEDAASNGE